MGILGTEGFLGTCPVRFIGMTAQEEFQNWFIQHEVELFRFEADQERIF